MSVLPFYNSRPDRLMTFRDPVWECVVLLSDEFEKLNIFLSRGCFCGRLEFKTKYNAAGEISTKSSGRDVLVYWAVIITGGPLIVPFYVPAKIGCNAKQYYERPTILCHL